MQLSASYALKRTLLVITVLLGLSAAIVGGAFYLKSLQTKSTSLTKIKPVIKTKAAIYKKNLDRTVLTTLASPNDKNIATAYQNAIRQTDYIKAYNAYVNVYNLIAKKYNSTHKPAYKQSLDRLEVLIQVFPQYNQKNLLPLVKVI